MQGSSDVFQLLRTFTVLHSGSSQRKRSKYSVKQLILTIQLVNEIVEQSAYQEPQILPYGPLFMLSLCCCMPLSRVFILPRKSPERVVTRSNEHCCAEPAASMYSMCMACISMYVAYEGKIQKCLTKTLNSSGRNKPLYPQGKSHPPALMLHDPTRLFLMANASSNIPLRTVR